MVNANAVRVDYVIGRISYNNMLSLVILLEMLMAPSTSATSSTSKGGSIGYDADLNYYEYEQDNAMPIVKGRLLAGRSMPILKFWIS